MKELSVRTGRHTEFVDITDRVQAAVVELGVQEGVCTVYVPHTTAGLTINENADPSVVEDMVYALDQATPWRSPHYRHSEGNTAAHVKSSLMGHSVQLLILGGRLQLGTWQSVYLCEFDGPRSRKVWLTAIGEAAQPESTSVLPDRRATLDRRRVRRGEQTRRISQTKFHHRGRL